VTGRAVSNWAGGPLIGSLGLSELLGILDGASGTALAGRICFCKSIRALGLKARGFIKRFGEILAAARQREGSPHKSHCEAPIIKETHLLSENQRNLAIQKKNSQNFTVHGYLPVKNLSCIY